MKHLTSFLAVLTDQLVAYLQEAREAGLDNFLELVLARVLVSLEPIRAASDE